MFIISTEVEQRAAASLEGDGRFGVITAWIATLRKEAESALIAASDTVLLHRMQGRIEVLDALLQLADERPSSAPARPQGNALHF